MPAESDTAADVYQSSLAKVCAIGAVMLAMSLEMLDMTVINVALPHMMGSLGATADQIIWVMSSYMVSAAMVMPLSGYLSRRLGRRRILMLDITGFIVASALCGAATTLPELVFFRMIQGACGGTLAPLSQAIMWTSFSRERRGNAMGIWGIGMMVIPLLGPTFGGFIVDSLSWRWVFYINIPLGLFALMLVSAYVIGEPGKQAKIDWIGLTLMWLTIGSLQVMLDLGNSRDWFNSWLIRFLAAVVVVAGSTFTYRSWGRSGTIVNFDVYRDRNFASASLILASFIFAMQGLITLLPMMTQQLMHYPAEEAGIVGIPRGIATTVAMLIIGPLMRKFDPRWLMFTGAVILAGGTFVYAYFSLDVSPGWVSVPGILQGVGLALFSVTSSVVAYETLPRPLIDGATGLFSLVRAICGSFGVAIVGFMLARRDEYHWQVLGSRITAHNPQVYQWLDAQGLSMGDPQANAMLFNTVASQARMMAFTDMYTMMALFILLIAPVILTMRHLGRAAPEAVAT